ncbi:MAG: hypothetical protein KGH69_04295 [Candidatus Micrarchaeota archaeon]|nr:hypothetical protein [Candidatus Micrarchaeota archaeon]
MRELVVGSREELSRALRSVQPDPKKVFLKLLDPKYSLRRKEHGSIECAIQPYADIEAELRRAARMHEIIPENSPGLIAVVRDGETGKVSGYAMEFIDGSWFANYYYARPKAAREYLKETAKLLRILHDNGFAHGDIAPTNIIIGNDNRIYLIDPEAKISASGFSADVRAICAMHGQVNDWIRRHDAMMSGPKVA